MADFVIPDGAFMPLGDNSPQSQDARMWGGLPYLERQLLIGEAILIYFPHAWRGPFFPLFWPNFQRMSLIH
jgi:signal peptidase I